MVFCCWESPDDQADAFVDNNEFVKNGVFPGQRRLVRTGGNALMDAPDNYAPLPSVQSTDEMVAGE